MIELKHDRAGDVLYARRDGATIAQSREAPEDGYLILNMDRTGDVVGVQLLGVAEMPAASWLSHPDRDALPRDLLEALDEWLQHPPTDPVAAATEPSAHLGERDLTPQDDDPFAPLGQPPHLDVYLADGPVVHDHVADAEVAGKMLVWSARVVNEYEKRRQRARASSATRRTPGLSRPPVQRAHRALVGESLRGSFGFRLQADPHPQDDASGTDALMQFHQLVLAVAAGQADEALAGLSRSARAAVRDLFKMLSHFETGLRVEAPGEAVPIVRLDLDQLRSSYAQIIRMREKVEVVKLRGVFRGILPSPRRGYQFVAAEDMIMSAGDARVSVGPVDAAMTDGEIALIQDVERVSVDAFFRVTRIRREQAPDREVWTLIGVRRPDGSVIGRTSDDDADESPEGDDAVGMRSEGDPLGDTDSDDPTSE